MPVYARVDGIGGSNLVLSASIGPFSGRLSAQLAQTAVDFRRKLAQTAVDFGQQGPRGRLLTRLAGA